MRHAARVDQNQQQIVAALRAVGALVADLHAVGHGVPDTLVCYRDVLYLLELKTPRGRLTQDQMQFHLRWPVFVVRTPEEALRAIGAMP